MNFKKVLVLLAGLLVLSSPLWAQDSTMTRHSRQTTQPARLEVIPMGGYVWTISQSATYQASGGDLDIKSGGFWGIAVDLNLHPAAQLRLLYRRQDSELTWKSRGTTETLGDMSVEYLHIGVVKGLTRGNVKPFSGITLGGTRYNTDIGDEWKFSAIVSLGAKIYVNEKIGLMVGGNLPITFTNAFLGIGTGGLSIGGSGITQLDLAAGLMISLY